MMTIDGGASYSPYFDPDYDSLVEPIHSPRVCIDNEACEDCTLVKVDSANRHGILLQMVQVLTDLDLVISKSYISSDGGWLMDVFHVTDKLGNKLADPALFHFIEQSLVPERKGVGPVSGQVQTCLVHQLASEHTALELTASDRPGILSEISAVLTELDCHLVAIHVWTHNQRAACIAYVADRATRRPISDPARLAQIEDQVDSVVGVHQGPGERRWVRVSGPFPGRIHPERRLHQLMREDRDYEAGPPPPAADADQFAAANIEVRRKGWLSSSMGMETRASIDSWTERGYSVVNVRSRDRPKLLFDTVCTLTDMQYLVFHAAISSHGPLALQEYYIRHMDGCTILETESERQRVTRCLVAAVERRVSHGLRLDLCTRNRPGLLSDVTRAFRENGLSLTRVECVTRGERAMGTFFVTDAYGGEVHPERMEAVRREIDGSVSLAVKVNSGWPPLVKSKEEDPPLAGSSNNVEEGRPKSSLGSLLWSRIERFSIGFGPVGS